MEASSSRPTSFLGKFLVLKGASRELWIVFACKALQFAAYGLVNSTLILWLSSDLGFDDVRAGLAVAAWSAVMTLCTVMVGSLVDAIGLRRAMLAGFGICVVARGVMAFTLSRWVALPLGLLPLAVGESLMTPVMVAAIKRFATTGQRSMSFSVFYVMMNLGLFVAGWTFDKMRGLLGEHGRCILPILGIPLTTYQIIIFLGFLVTIPNLFIIYFWLRPGVEATDEGLRITPEQPKYDEEPWFRGAALSCRDAWRDWIRIFSGLWTQPAFYRFLAFLTLAVAVRLIIFNWYYVFPKYGIRELGEGAPIGRIFLSLNTALIIVLAPIIGALTQRFSAYKVVIWGSFIAASSVFFMALPAGWFQPLADGWLGALIAHRWLGVQGAVVNPLYVSIVLSVVLYSIGEAFYSPRLYEYPAAIAPKGQEGSYMALSFLPYFVAKFFMGGLSGFLLKAYCPAQGPRSSGTMWAVIGAIAMITPLGLLAFRRYIQVHEAGRED